MILFDKDRLALVVAQLRHSVKNEIGFPPPVMLDSHKLAFAIGGTSRRQRFELVGASVVRQALGKGLWRSYTRKRTGSGHIYRGSQR